MVQKEGFYKAPFKEQMDYFWSKKAVPQESLKDLEDNYHDYSFSVAGLTRADLLEDLRFLVGKAIEDGEGYDDFLKKFNRAIMRKGWKPTPDPESREYARRVQTIIDTNQRQSHRAGRYQQQEALSPKSPFRFRYWVHRDSPNFRKAHKALHMKALEVNDPFWKKCLPACAWGCRCDSFLATEQMLGQRGIEILKKAPDAESIADPEFMHIPGSKGREKVIKEATKKVAPDLRRTIGE